MRTIKFEEVLAFADKDVWTVSRKDNSVRGNETVSIYDVNRGDKIVIDNHFTLVV